MVGIDLCTHDESGLAVDSLYQNWRVVEQKVNVVDSLHPHHHHCYDDEVSLF
jgi:hypothetical protein